jgi:hypothetical protein
MGKISIKAMLCVLAGAGCHEASTPGQAPTATSEPLPPLPPSGIVKPSGTVEERLVLAEDLAAKKEYAKAIEKVDEAIRIDPRNRRALFLASKYRHDLSMSLPKKDPKAYPLMQGAGDHYRFLRDYYPEASEEEEKFYLEMLYNEASAHARSLRVEETTGALTELVGSGFKDFDRLRNDPDWRVLLTLPSFQKSFSEITKSDAKSSPDSPKD